MLFQLVLTIFFKSKLFLCLPKVDHNYDQLMKKPIKEDRNTWQLKLLVAALGRKGESDK